MQPINCDQVITPNRFFLLSSANDINAFKNVCLQSQTIRRPEGRRNIAKKSS